MSLHNNAQQIELAEVEEIEIRALAEAKFKNDKLNPASICPF